jgi:hypothetical protein
MADGTGPTGQAGADVSFADFSLQIANSALIAYTPFDVETDTEARDVRVGSANAQRGTNLMIIPNSRIATKALRAVGARGWARGLFLLALGAPLTFFPAPASGQDTGTAQAASSVTQKDVKLVIGGDRIKDNSQGTLSVVGSRLQFATAKAKMEVDALSIQDISTNEDSRQDITGAAHFATMAIPYGGGRVLSLFSHKVDVLTVEFKDAQGGYHGTVFVLPQGQAAPIKKQLVAMGAKAKVPLAEPAATNK